MWTRRLSRIGAAAAAAALASPTTSASCVSSAPSLARVAAMYCATAPVAAATSSAAAPEQPTPAAASKGVLPIRRRRGLALAQRRQFVRAIFGKAAGTISDTPGGLRAHRRKVRARVRADTLSGADVVIRAEGSEAAAPLKEGERAALGFFSERRLWSKKARRAAASKTTQLQKAQAFAVEKTASVARAAVNPSPFDPTAPLPKADAATGGFIMEPSAAAAKHAATPVVAQPRKPVGPRLGDDLDVDLGILDRLNAALRLPVHVNVPAQREALAIAEANLDTLPPLLIARLAAHKWARGMLPPALHTKLRHALFTRCGDMSGPELAVAMAVWSRNEQHATDSGMLQKLGRLLAFHIREVDQADQIVTVWRALVRTRVVPSTAFLKVLSRRYGDLVVAEIRLYEESVAAAVAKAREDAVAQAPVDFSATPSDDSEKAAADDASRRIAKAVARSSLRIRRPESIRLRAMFDALHLQRKLGSDTMDERTVITLVREFSTIVERELLLLGVLNPAEMATPEKLLLCGNDAPLLERAKEAAAQRNREQHLVGRMTAREAAEFVRLRRLTVDDVRVLFDVIEQYDVQSRRYLRPVCHLLAGLCPALRRGVFFSVVFPFVLKADFHRLDPVLIRVVLSVAPGLSKTCDWEDTIRMVQFARFAKKNGFPGLVAADGADSAAAAPPPCVADVERLAAKITHRLEAPRRPPTAHETVEIGRQMHALARNFPSVEPQAIQALEHVLKRALLLLRHRFIVARDAETVIELGTVASAKLSPECRAAVEEFKVLRGKLAAEAAARGSRKAAGKADAAAKPNAPTGAAAATELSTPVSQFSAHSLDDVAAPELSASGKIVLPGPGAICRQILALNARHVFTELPSAEAKRDLEALKWAVAKKHPRTVLRALDAIEACFPQALQMQIVAGVGEVLTARLAVPTAEAPAGSPLTRASRFDAVFSDGAPKFEDAAEFRDFVNLTWRTAPQAVKHQPSVWRYVEWQAQKFGDQDLVTKAQKVRGVFELRRR